MELISTRAFDVPVGVMYCFYDSIINKFWIYCLGCIDYMDLLYSLKVSPIETILSYVSKNKNRRHHLIGHNSIFIRKALYLFTQFIITPLLRCGKQYLPI